MRWRGFIKLKVSQGGRGTDGGGRGLEGKVFWLEKDGEEDGLCFYAGFGLVQTRIGGEGRKEGEPKEETREGESSSTFSTLLRQPPLELVRADIPGSRSLDTSRD